ncbi:MAG: heme-binding protein [Proteobacteria bacterium]|nr:heme-binding protein [Pseudomonadota bacterium]
MNNRYYSLIQFILLLAVGSFIWGGAVQAKDEEEDPTPTFSIDILSMEIADTIVNAAVKECSRRGYDVSSAVVDRGGNLLAFLRNPFAGPHTIIATQQKAYSAASIQARTSAMGHRPDLSFAPGVLLIKGGIPISFNGKFYGGVAVGGAPPTIDEKCADAGLAAIKEVMDFVE